MRLLVTAGPTREHIDDVRFISNASSGRMGCAIAAAALARGHDVVLVCGPLQVAPPACRLRRVVSTSDMLEQACEALPKADAVIMAAAPADFRPASRADHKISKGEGGLTLELVPTPDILTEVARRRTRQVLVGFALETQDLVARARHKLEAKGLDLIVANAPSAVAADRSSVHILYPGGSEELIENESKDAIAQRLVEIVEGLVAQRRTEA